MEDAYEATLQITGMQCNGCVNSVKNALAGLEGVHQVSVDLDSKEATVMYQDDKIEIEDLREAVESAGYSVEGVKRNN